jgi:hypothetical protein
VVAICNCASQQDKLERCHWDSERIKTKRKYFISIAGRKDATRKGDHQI